MNALERAWLDAFIHRWLDTLPDPSSQDGQGAEGSFCHQRKRDLSNDMPTPPESASPPTRDESPSKRARVDDPVGSLDTHQFATHLPDDDNPFDNDKTSNALAQARAISLHSLPPPDLGQTPTRLSKPSLYQSPSRTSTAKSASPVKSHTLNLLKKPVHFVNFHRGRTRLLPDDVISLSRDITSIIVHKDKVLPGSLRSEFHVEENNDGTIRPGWYFEVDDDDEAKKTQHKSEHVALYEIRDAAITCCTEVAAEAAWNLEVHGPLLKLALQPFSSLRRDILTTACISKPFLPEMRAETPYEYTRAKIVDFGVRVCLPPHLTKFVEQAIIGLPEKESYINQTSYEPVRNDPIAMVIETKIATGGVQEARLQLGIWVASWHQRMKMLIGTSSTKPLVTLPLIIVMEHEWHLLFACDRQDKIEIVGSMAIGSTDSIVGLYTILATLRVIGKWMQDTYLVWFEEMITKLG